MERDDELQQKLENLERMVLTAASSRATVNGYPTPDANPEELRSPSESSKTNRDLHGKPVGMLERHGQSSFYAGDTAFNVILQEVSHHSSCYYSPRTSKCL